VQASIGRRTAVGATAGAASIAWGIGMLPSTLTDLGVSIDFGQPAVWVLIVLGGVLILISIPVAQLVTLRNEVDRAWRWVPVNVVAWLVGMTFTFLPGPFIDECSPMPLMVVCFVVAGLAMALTVAIVTGYWMQKFLAERAEQLLER
jgi:hypothetical protein